MTGAGDPVGQGFVQSLARPGGNFTGLSLQSTETTGKRLELLKELAPGAAPMAVLWDRRLGLLSRQAVEAAAKERGGSCSRSRFEMPARSKGRAFKAATGARVGALLVLP